MAYVNGTTHYNLPQTVGTDKRDWADTNAAFAAIDAALYGAVDDVAQAETDISDLKSRMTTAEGNIVDNTADIAGLDTRLTTAEGAITSQGAQITDTRQDLEDMICAYNEASATSTHAYAVGDYFIYNDVLYKATQAIAIGDTIVPDTNCATTNVTTEIASIEDLSGDVTQLQTDVGQLQTDITGKADKPTSTSLYSGVALRNSTIATTVWTAIENYTMAELVNATVILTSPSDSLAFKFGRKTSTTYSMSNITNSGSFGSTQNNGMTYFRDSNGDTHCWEYHVNPTSSGASDVTSTELFTDVTLIM